MFFSESSLLQRAIVLARSVTILAIRPWCYQEDYATRITSRRGLACTVLVNSRGCQVEMTATRFHWRCWYHHEYRALRYLLCRVRILDRGRVGAAGGI